MTKIIGRQKNIGIAKESVRGAGASPSFWVPKVDFTIDNKVVKARTREGYSNITMEGNQAIVAKEWAEGDMLIDLQDKNFGLLLLALLGSETPSGPTDSAYTHTYTLSNTNQHQSLAISVIESTLSSMMFKLAMVNSLEITVVPEEVVSVKVNFMSKKGVTTVQTSSYSAENKFIGRDLVFKLASLTSGLSGASTIPLKKLVLKFDKNAVLDHNLGTVQPQDILNQGFRITGQVELDYQNRTYADLMSNGTYNAVRIALINTRAVIGAATNPSFTIDLSRADFDQWESDFGNDKIATQKFNFTALYDLTNGNLINSCTLVNAQATY